ncbi:MAG: hypothetical protein ACXVHK_22360, partial [Solirubrobacteraceae bacterium]
MRQRIGVAARMVGSTWRRGIGPFGDPAVVVSVLGGLGWNDEEAMEPASEVSLEASQRALVGLPFGLFA